VTTEVAEKLYYRIGEVEEIAGVLETTPGAVRVRASRAYEALRDALAPSKGGAS